MFKYKARNQRAIKSYKWQAEHLLDGVDKLGTSVEKYEMMLKIKWFLEINMKILEGK